MSGKTQLIYASSVRSADMRHVVPVAIHDAFPYISVDGKEFAFVHDAEAEACRAAGLTVVPFSELGLAELIEEGYTSETVMLELLVRACRHLEVTEASVPAEFPLAATRHLEQIGVSISAEPEWFANRRRAKLPREIAGTENAALATLDAMEAIRSAIHATAEVSSESLRQLAYVAAAKHGAVLECAIVSHGPQAAEIHNAGAGAIAEGESVVVDLGARDLDSGCYSDMTRTFCRGRAPAQLVEMHEICLEALEKSLRQVRVGISGGELHRVADDAIAAYGVATPLTVPGDLTEGFIHPLGHGVGLEIHESPDIEPNGQELIAGDVIALEPGIYRPGFGGCRLEDLVTVTADGGRVLTEYPYEL